jgi:hypothetical protein
MADDCSLGLSLVIVIEVPPMVTPVEVSADFVEPPHPATTSAVAPRTMVSCFPRMTGSLSRLCVANGRNQRSLVFALSPPGAGRAAQQTLLTTAEKLVGVEVWGSSAKEAAFG